MTKALIVEDDFTIAEGVELFLRKENFRTERASDGQRALELWRIFQPDIILLDIGLPKLDGLEVLKTIRTKDDVPIIMLTARSEEIDELLGLGLGADNYITKPFSLRILLAHINAVLKRHKSKEDTQQTIHIGSIEIDTYRTIAKIKGKPLNLTVTEFKLLHHLSKMPNRAVSRWELLDAALPEGETLERAVDSHMKNLRKKLAEAGVENCIETVWGVGYRMIESDERI